MPTMPRNKKLTETHLISEELLKLYSNISSNVGIDKIMPYVALSEPFYIIPILGQPLTDELKEQISTGNITEENKGLIIKIAPSLSLWTDYLAIRSLSYSITQKGIVKEHSENSEALNEKEIAEYKLDIKEKAEMATDLLIQYLCRCRETYPLWRPEQECLCEKYEPKEGTNETTFKPLMYFPKKGSLNKCKNKC